MNGWSIFLGVAVVLAIIGVVWLLLSISVFFIYAIIAGVGIIFFSGFIINRIKERRYELELAREKEERKILNEVRNTKGQLHSVNEPAIVRVNGCGEYYIEGVQFDVNLWQQIVKKSMSIQDCFQINNIEQRRIAMKYCLTPDKFLENWKELRMMNRDKRGNALYEYTHQELNESIKVLVYKDPSTDREYYSFVPPNVTNATSAMAWKFQLTDREYDNLRFEA